MKIAQLTDLHIGFEGQDTSGVDVRSNFKKVLSEVEKFHPDFLVITGDLCYRDGENSIYSWIKSHIENLDFPTYILAGNHDDSNKIAEVFNLFPFVHDGDLFFNLKTEDYNLLFLDSGKGSLNKIQMNWLKEQLSLADLMPIIFMHHPPCICGVPFMDNKYAFQQSEAFKMILPEVEAPIPVFCGHYHVDRIVLRNQMLVHITPSTFFQIDANCDDFKLDHHRIGFRQIFLEKDKLSSSVKYL